MLENLLVILLIVLGLGALLALSLGVLLLFTPFRVAGRASRWPDERPTGRVLVRWPGWPLGVGLEMAFDSVGQAFTLWLGPWAVWRRYEERGPEPGEELWERLAEGVEALVEEVEEAEEEEKGAGWPLTWRETLAQRGVLPVVARAIIRIIGGLRWERLWLNGRIGLDNPAHTGMLYGAYEALRHGWPTPPLDARLVPEFAGPALWGEAAGAVRIWGWRVLWPLVRLALSRPVLRLVGALIRGWWRQRRQRKRRQGVRRWQRQPAAG